MQRLVFLSTFSQLQQFSFAAAIEENRCSCARSARTPTSAPPLPPASAGASQKFLKRLKTSIDNRIPFRGAPPFSPNARAQSLSSALSGGVKMDVAESPSEIIVVLDLPGTCRSVSN